MLIRHEPHPADVQIWDNRDAGNTWKITTLNGRTSDLFLREFGIRVFQIKESDLLKLLILCAANGLVVSAPMDVVLPTLMDLEGNPVKDPKI